MKKFIDQILNLPRQQRVGILVGLIVVILALDYFYLYTPQADQIGGLMENIEGARNERDKKKKLAANLTKLRQQNRELDGMLKQAVAQLPDRKEIPDLLSSVSTKATESGLEILIFRPLVESYQDFYAEIPVDIVVRGGFHNIVTFFDEVGRMNRLVNIGSIDLKNPKVNADQVVIETSARATTFRFLDEAERKKVAEEKAKAAKKSK